MMGRALAPVEQAVSQWKSLTSTRSAWQRLKMLFEAIPPQTERTQLPPPQGTISVEGLLVAAPGRQVPILKGLNFQVEAGETIALIGPSAAGKSTLARTLVGAWPVAQGAVRLDGSDLRHYDNERLGRFIGYLPQDVELFAGTVAENIARMGEVDDAEVVAAAELAGVHQIIQTLPDGYDTQIGEGGAVLSAGQRQRIGLARAVYGTPNLIVLDEPNANLDQAGDEALSEALKRIKSRGTTIVLVTHKPNLLGVADRVMLLSEGALKLFGPTDQVLQQLRGPRVVPGPTMPKPDPAAGQIANGSPDRVALSSEARGAR
jgi:PrtD family type I secretion system ABC transporter